MFLLITKTKLSIYKCYERIILVVILKIQQHFSEIYLSQNNEIYSFVIQSWINILSVRLEIAVREIKKLVKRVL